MTLAVPTTRQYPGRGANGGQPVYAHQMSDGAYGRNYASLRPKTKPLVHTIGAGGITAFGAVSATQIDVISFPDNQILIEMYQNTAQTLLPRLVVGTETDGLEIGLDLVDNETVEYVVGGNHNANPYAYTVGTSAPAAFRCTMRLADGSGTDNFGIGWRKVQAYAAAVAPIFLAATDPTYTDFVFLGVAAAGVDQPIIRTCTDLNDSAVPVLGSTGITWADGKVHTLEVRIYGRRVVYFINGKRMGDRVSKDGLGAALTAQDGLTPPVFNFDTGDILVPFIFNRFATTTPGLIHIVPNGVLPGIEVGPLSEMGLDNANLQMLSL